MYTVRYTERFEDFYVSESDVFYYETIQSACKGFEEITRGLLINAQAIEGLRLYVEDYHSEGEDIDSYVIGIVVTLEKDDELVASIDLLFDPRSSTLKFENELVIEFENLSAIEEDQLNDLANRL